MNRGVARRRLPGGVVGTIPDIRGWNIRLSPGQLSTETRDDLAPSRSSNRLQMQLERVEIGQQTDNMSDEFQARLGSGNLTQTDDVSGIRESPGSLTCPQPVLSRVARARLLVDTLGGAVSRRLAGTEAGFEKVLEKRRPVLASLVPRDNCLLDNPRMIDYLMGTRTAGQRREAASRDTSAGMDF
ncbi:hypothetical protein Bbelb_195810 [Branchiostoma belcheri]|nr:hypothetical protein Bbelb_195810 [Branchiostoma belcheri]